MERIWTAKEMAAASPIRFPSPRGRLRTRWTAIRWVVAGTLCMEGNVAGLWLKQPLLSVTHRLSSTFSSSWYVPGSCGGAETWGIGVRRLEPWGFRRNHSTLSILPFASAKGVMGHSRAAYLGFLILLLSRRTYCLKSTQNASVCFNLGSLSWTAPLQRLGETQDENSVAYRFWGSHGTPEDREHAGTEESLGQAPYWVQNVLQTGLAQGVSIGGLRASRHEFQEVILWLGGCHSGISAQSIWAASVGRAS